LCAGAEGNENRSGHTTIPSPRARAGWRVATFAKAGERLGIVGRGRIYSVYIHGESDEVFARTERDYRFTRHPVLPKSAGESYGEIQTDLESKGEMIGNNDLWIAAHALAAELTLVTNNKEFRRIGGLKVQNWVG
jgi:hypothetical protein